MYQNAAGIAHAAEATVRSVETVMALHRLGATIDRRMDGLSKGISPRDLPRLPPLQFSLAPADAMSDEPLKISVPMDALPAEVLPHLLVIVSAVTDMYYARNQQDWRNTIEMVHAAIKPQQSVPPP
jgi:hypothetical protein